MPLSNIRTIALTGTVDLSDLEERLTMLEAENVEQFTAIAALQAQGPSPNQTIATTGDNEMQNWQIRTANYTAQNRDRIIADTTASAWSLTLPPNAVYGHEIEVLIDGTNALTLSPNGANLNGSIDNLAITSDRAKLAIVYKDADRGWIVGIGATAGGGNSTPSTTPEADLVIAAIEATGATLTDPEKQACKDRIAAMKTNGTWAIRRGFYGFLGSSAAAHAINWKNPDTYNLVWSGDITHSVLGVKGDGLSAKGSTGYVMDSEGFITDKIHFTFYCRTESAAGTWDCGAFGPNNSCGAALRWTNDQTFLDAPVGSRVAATSPGSAGVSVFSMNSGQALIVHDGQLVASPSVPPASLSTINAPLEFMANGSNRSYGSFSWGDPFTLEQAQADYSAEVAYQTALGRQV